MATKIRERFTRTQYNKNFDEGYKKGYIDAKAEEAKNINFLFKIIIWLCIVISSSVIANLMITVYRIHHNLK